MAAGRNFAFKTTAKTAADRDFFDSLPYSNIADQWRI